MLTDFHHILGVWPVASKARCTIKYAQKSENLLNVTAITSTDSDGARSHYKREVVRTCALVGDDWGDHG